MLGYEEIDRDLPDDPTQEQFMDVAEVETKQPAPRKARMLKKVGNKQHGTKKDREARKARVRRYHGKLTPETIEHLTPKALIAKGFMEDGRIKKGKELGSSTKTIQPRTRSITEFRDGVKIQSSGMYKSCMCDKHKGRLVDMSNFGWRKMEVTGDEIYVPQALCKESR